MADSMVCDRLRHHANAPASEVEAPTQIRVLVAVEECIVEAADRIERRPAHQQSRTVGPEDIARCVCNGDVIALVRVPGQTDRTEDAAVAVQKVRPVGVDNTAAHGTDIRLCREDGTGCLKPARVQTDVAVHEGDVSGIGLSPAQVACGRRPFRTLTAVGQLDSGPRERSLKAGNYRLGSVGGAVVDQRDRGWGTPLLQKGDERIR